MHVIGSALGSGGDGSLGAVMMLGSGFVFLGSVGWSINSAKTSAEEYNERYGFSLKTTYNIENREFKLQLSLNF